jgi:hypothetical protein
MASWIVHLRIAENLLKDIKGLDTPMFAIGNIAPDSGIPDENWENFTPPVEVTHFRLDDRRGNEDLRFYKKVLAAESLTDDAQRYSFLLGYFFHLVTDNFWWKRIGKPTLERFKAEHQADDRFIWEVKRDWYGLDFIYVRDHPDSIFWQSFLQSEIQESYLDFLPIEALHHRMAYIKDFYQRQDEKVQEMYSRPYIYLSKTEMDQFVSRVSGELLQIHQYLSDSNQDISGYASALELPCFST